MPNVSESQRKQEFNENFEIMNESKEALTAYTETFLDQTNAENLLATGGGSNLGSIEKELAALSVMNEIRINQRQQVFSEDTVFSGKSFLKMRDKSFIEAAGEIGRRKAIKSHRYDKTRKNRAETANDTMAKANDKIRTLQRRLRGENGAAVPGKLQKVSAMEDIYDSIRIADRNFAEALSLNKEEEKKLKDKAELTYRVSLKRMYEREMEGLDENSRDYIKIKRKYDDNLRIYNELMRPVMEKRAQAEADEGIAKESEEKVEFGPQLEVMDKEAEESVNANVELFEKFHDTLEDAKYGTTADPIWSEMKTSAFNLITGWNNMTDAQRGEALFYVMFSANKYLANSRVTNKKRALAAKEFRNFFKSTLDGMSLNCRVLALDEIYKNLDRAEANPDTSEELKKQNKSLLSEMAREMLIKKGTLSKNDKFYNEIDDDFYRVQYSLDKAFSKASNVAKLYGNTKEFAIASMKFDFSRNMFMEMLSDSFRLDRFGRVIPGDEKKAENWGKLISDMSRCNTNEALEIQRKWYMRTARTPVDKDFFSEKVFRKYYEFTDYTRKLLSTENYGTDWKMMTPDSVKNAVKKWNDAHPDNKISEKDVKLIDRNELIKQKNNIEKLPLFKAMTDMHLALDGKGYVHMLQIYKGMGFGIFEVHPRSDDSFEDNKAAEKLVRTGKEGIFHLKEGDMPLYHQDGTELNEMDDAQEVREGYLVRQNQQNPLLLSHEYLQEKAKEVYREQKPILERAENSMKRMEVRQERLNNEKAFMAKIKTLVPENMKNSAKADLEKLQKLFNEFIDEAAIQIVQKEMLDECDMKAASENGKSQYSVQALKYEKQKIKMNDLFEKLDKAQSSFIKKYAGEGAYKKWKQDLDKIRAEAAMKEQELIDDGSTAAERVIRAYENKEANSTAEAFSDDEIEQIKKNCQDRKIEFKREQVNRVLQAFILPVHRDFTGAPLTEADRYKADYNKRFKAAVLKHDSNKLKELSREFVKNTLPKLKAPTPDEIDALDIDKLDKSYCNDGLIYSRVKLNMTSCVNNNFNTMFPELKAGLDELKIKDKKKYNDIVRICNVEDETIYACVLLANGYDIEHSQIIPDEQAASYQPMLQGMKQHFRTKYVDKT